MDCCFLHYSNSSFFSQLDYSGSSGNNLTGSDVAPSGDITSGLLSNLTNRAPGNGGFASGSSAYSLSDGVSRQVYGLAQCLRDLSIGDCRSCLQNGLQNVMPSKISGYQAISGSCILRSELYPFYLSDEVPPTPSPAPLTPSPAVDRPAPASAPKKADSPLHPKAEGPAGKTSGTNSKRSPISLAIILVIIGSAILAIVLVCIFAMRKKMLSLILKKRRAVARDNKDAPHKMVFNKEQIVFSLQTLIEATAGFSSNNKLGEGGFGSVFKGVIQDGQEIAVKKLSARSGQGTKEFMNKVEIVANVQHRNLVKLLGCCVEGEERLLVYEFIPNKSLDTFLFDPMKSRQLAWQTRFDIITGIARGLLYLHQDSRVRIIQRH